MDRKVRIPDHVVFRAFAAETVLLNLDTGKYHGLNPTGGKMLEVLDKSTDVREAASTVASELDHPVEEVEQDLCALCDELLDRGIVELR